MGYIQEKYTLGQRQSRYVLSVLCAKQERNSNYSKAKVVDCDHNANKIP